MPHGLLIRLRPNGPWRIGSDSGALDETADLYHSDSLYSAITHTMRRLGEMDAWVGATAGTEQAPAVRLSSCFPWQGDDLFVVPPRTLWPPVSPPLPRLRRARFLPLSMVESLLQGKGPDENGWSVAGPSRCLVPEPSGGGRSSPGPYQVTVRSVSAVDRVSRLSAEAHSIACFEFNAGAGLWFAASFAGDDARERWSGPLRAAIRLLADSGFGGRRSAGWGRSQEPEIQEGEWPDLLLRQPPTPEPSPPQPEETEPASMAQTGYWLLSLYRPAPQDSVDWNRGNYSLLTRGGRTESAQQWGAEKKLLRMVGEGSVLIAGSEPLGSSADVRPEGFPHPILRFGSPLSIPIPVGGGA